MDKFSPNHEPSKPTSAVQSDDAEMQARYYFYYNDCGKYLIANILTSQLSPSAEISIVQLRTPLESLINP